MAARGGIPKRVQLDLSTFTLEDIVQELDQYTPESEPRESAENKLLRLNPEVHQPEPPTNAIKREEASVLPTLPMGTPEHMNKSTELQSGGKKAITGEIDTVIRRVGPKSNKTKVCLFPRSCLCFSRWGRNATLLFPHDDHYPKGSNVIGCTVLERPWHQK